MLESQKLAYITIILDKMIALKVATDKNYSKFIVMG